MKKWYDFFLQCYWNPKFTLENPSSFHSNELTGTLPTEWSAWGQITAMYGPFCFRCFTLVTSFSFSDRYLYANTLTGSLPTEWSSFVNVYDLYASTLAFHCILSIFLQISEVLQNNLMGTIPTEYTNLISLKIL